MPRQLDDAGSAMLQKKLEDLGIRIHLNKSTSAIEGTTGVQQMVFADGTILEVDMIIVSAGIQALHVGQRIRQLPPALQGGRTAAATQVP